MRQCLLLSLFAFAAAPGFLFAADGIVGARWSVEAKGSKKGEWEKQSVFRATNDGKVHLMEKVIGSYTSKGNDIEIIITGRKGDDKNGTYKVTRLKNDGTTWIGTLYSKDGKEHPIRIVLLKD